MNIRRALILALFFGIAVSATCRTLLRVSAGPGGKGLLNRLLLVSVSLPFFITAFVLVLFTLREE